MREAGFRWQCCGHPALSDGAGHSVTETTVLSPEKRQNHSGRLFVGRTVCTVGIHSDKAVLRCRRRLALCLVWFPGWMDFEQRHPMQAQHIYLSLGDKEEHTKNAVMAAVGDNIRTLHSRLIERGADCTLEWNSGGHFKDANLRTARAFRWAMEENR